MKKFIIILIVTTASLSTFQPADAQSDKSSRTKDNTNSIKLVQYVCPMHPDITSDKPGKCSKCGMNLTLSKKEQMKADVVKYTCPMHPEIVSDKLGKCSKCGMNLTLSKKEQMKSDVVNGYTCPMHPEVSNDKPGKCPKCGMNLVQKKADPAMKKE